MLASLLLGLALAPVDEPPPTVPAADHRLQWQAPAGCPDATAIEARIAALARGREDGQGTLEIAGTVVEGGEGFVLRLRTSLRGDTSERELSSRDCAELGEATALVVAVALEPSLGATPPREQEPEADEGVVPPPLEAPDEDAADPPVDRIEDDTLEEPIEPRVDRPTSADERSRGVPPPRGMLRAGLGPELGVLPSATAALRLEGGPWWPRVRILLAATYFAPRRASGPSESAALYQQGTLAAVGCGVWSRRAWSVPLCAGVEAGILRADSRQLPSPRTATGPWLGPLARVGVARSFGRAGLSLDLEGVARGVGTRVVVDDNLAFRSSAGSLRLFVGFEFAWR